jgi:hypothetical protein
VSVPVFANDAPGIELLTDALDLGLSRDALMQETFAGSISRELCEAYLRYRKGEAAADEWRAAVDAARAQHAIEHGQE